MFTMGISSFKSFIDALGRENSIVAETSLLTGSSLITGLDASAHVQALLNSFILQVFTSWCLKV